MATTNDITMTVNPILTPAISVAATATTICAGTSVTFTSTPTNGGTAPVYQWKLNGTNISGATTAIYTSSSLADNDIVSCVLTSNETCLTTPTATTNDITMTVNPILTPAISVAASATTICAGTSVTFTATPTNGGTAPVYQWKLNGTNISGATTAIYTSSSLADNDIVSCVLTSNETCLTTPMATTNDITMTVNPILTPAISVAATATTICAGTSVTFTSTPTNGGTAPVYQWKLNGTNISGATTAIYTSSSLADNDIVSCVLTSNETCLTTPMATTNDITMTVNPILTPAISVAATATTICAGTSVTFTSTPTNGGTAPVYQWKLNGTNISGATTAIYTSSSLADNDIVSCVLTSNETCLTTPMATTNDITMTVNPILTPAISVAATATTICAGTSVTFTSTPTNGGTAPVYQWKLNGTNISGATTAIYTSSSLADNDIVSCVLTSNETCLTTPTATTNDITMTVGIVSISNQPADASILQSNPVVFSVSANGSGTLGYQWQLSTDGGATFANQNDGGVYVGMNTATMNIAWALLPMSGYKYRAVVTNNICTEISDAAKLIVLNTPGGSNVPAIMPDNNILCAGGNAGFSIVPSTYSIIKYQWQHSTNNGATWVNQYDGSIYGGMTSGTMSITGATAGMNNYKYRCTIYYDATNSKNSSVGTLTVKTVPVFNSQPSPVTACIGANATFAVNSPGNGSLSYQWQVSSNTGASWSTPSGSPYGNINTPTMSIAGVSMGLNSYRYRCEAGNMCGTVLSNPAILTIDQPITAVAASNSPVCEGGTLNLASSTAAASYSWTGPNDYVSASQNPVIANVASGSAGTYSVVVTSAAGCQNAPAMVTVTVNMKPSITAQPLPDVAMLNNKAAYTVGASSNSTSYQWQTSTDGGTSWANTEGLEYSGVTTAALNLDLNSPMINSLSGNKYLCIVGNMCGITLSNPVEFKLGSLSGTINYQYKVNGVGAVIPYSIYSATSGKGTTVYLYNQNDLVPLYSAELQASGMYTFPAVKPGTYGVGVKTGRLWCLGATLSNAYVNASDAAEVSNGNLTGIYKYASCTQTPGVQNPVADANAITVRFHAPMTPSIFPTGDWLFAADMPTSDEWINYYAAGTGQYASVYTRNSSFTCVMRTDNETLNIGALQVGDVNGNRPPTELRSSFIPDYLGNMITVPGQVIEVPVRLNRDAIISAVSLVLDGPGRYAKIEDIVMPNIKNGGRDGLTWTLVDGVVYLTWIGSEPMEVTTDDVFMVIKLRVSERFAEGDEFSATGKINFMEFSNEYGEVMRGFSLSMPLINYGVDDFNLSLGNSIPNPVTTTSRIPYYLPAEGKVQLAVYNIIGECIATLVNEAQNTGYHEATFDATGLAPGIYTYRLGFTTDSKTRFINKKLVVSY